MVERIDRIFAWLDDAWDSLIVFWHVFLSLALIVTVFGYLLWYGVTQ